MNRFVKKTWNRILKNRDILFAGFILTLVMLAIIFAAFWYFRADVFEYLAGEYLKETREDPPGPIAESIEEIPAEKIIEREIFTEEKFVVDAVKKTNPAVVSIVIYREVPKYEVTPNEKTQELLPGLKFSVPEYKENGTEKKEVGGGSGFLVSEDGLVVTNRHVVERANVTYSVFTNDGKGHDATVVARDPVLDIALIKINPAAGKSFPYLSLGDSEKLEVGQSVIAIGNALSEFRNTVSVGVISGLARSVTAGDRSGNTELLDHVIQTDAAINPGNSGGPLLDLSGRVIGVNVAIAKGSQNIGFALPINSVKDAILSVKQTGKIIRPYLGIRYTRINQELKEKNGLAVDYGVLLKSDIQSKQLAVVPGSPADKAGIVEGDIILEIDGVKLDTEKNLAAIIRGKKVGQTINLKILHLGVEKITRVTLEAAKDE